MQSALLDESVVVIRCYYEATMNLLMKQLLIQLFLNLLYMTTKQLSMILIYHKWFSLAFTKWAYKRQHNYNI